MAGLYGGIYGQNTRKMRRDAALAAAQAQAPIVPTSNMRRKQTAPTTPTWQQPQAAPQMQAQNSGPQASMFGGYTAPSRTGLGGVSIPTTAKDPRDVGATRTQGGGDFVLDLEGTDLRGPGGALEGRAQDLAPEVYDQAIAGIPTGDQLDDAWAKAIGDLLQGPRDTAAEKAAIEQDFLSKVGAGQADLNARMGAAGFGTSGALGAMSRDMRLAAAREAANQNLAVDRDARGEWLDRLGLGFQGRAQAQDEAWDDFLRQQITGLMGDGDGGDTFNGDGVDASEKDAADYGVPKGAHIVGTLAEGSGPDGKYYLVTVDGAGNRTKVPISADQYAQWAREHPKTGDSVEQQADDEAGEFQNQPIMDLIEAWKRLGSPGDFWGWLANGGT